MKVIWLRPSVGDNVSVRRERIAEHLEDMGVEVSICDASGTDALGAIKETITGDYDVILGNVRIGLYLGYLLSVLLRKPFVGDVSDPIEDIEDLPRPIFKIIYYFEWGILTRADACFFVETTSYEQAEERGLDPILVRNSVDYDRFSNPSEESKDKVHDILRRNGVDTDKPIAIYIGSMVPHYYLSEIGQAADKTPEWEFVFVGKERGADVRDIVSDRENAHYLGSHDYDLIPGFLYHASAAFCLADKEQPLKIMEYGAAGLPTIGYSGKLRKNFTEDEILFVDSDPEEISEALRMLSSNSELAEEYGENLQKKAKEHSWETVAEVYYEKIAEASQS